MATDGSCGCCTGRTEHLNSLSDHQIVAGSSCCADGVGVVEDES